MYILGYKSHESRGTLPPIRISQKISQVFTWVVTKGRIGLRKKEVKRGYTRTWNIWKLFMQVDYLRREKYLYDYSLLCSFFFHFLTFITIRSIKHTFTNNLGTSHLYVWSKFSFFHSSSYFDISHDIGHGLKNGAKMIEDYYR